MVPLRLLFSFALTVAPVVAEIPLAFDPAPAGANYRYVARSSQFAAWVRSDEVAVLARQSLIATEQMARNPALALAKRPAAATQTDLIRLRWKGGRKNAPIGGEETSPGVVNYLIGNDPSRWRTRLPRFRRVRAHDVYPGIDVIFYGDPQRLEYDFVIAPGADASRIVMEVDGATDMRINSHGDVELMTPNLNDFVLAKPRVFQADGVRVPTEYVLRGSNRLSFRLAAYDRSKPLTIDPTIVYAAGLGASDRLATTAIAVDSAGNSYITGYTCAADVSTTIGAYQQSGSGGIPFSYTCWDTYIAKLDPTGSTLLYMTYLGGNNNDIPTRILVDSSGNVILTGTTQSTNFPVTGTLGPPIQKGTCEFTVGGACASAFLAKLSADGSSLLNSTLLGGSSVELGSGLATGPDGSIYLAGYTTSPDFPVTPGAVQTTFQNKTVCNVSGRFICPDAFVAKISPDFGTILFATYLGGSDSDFATALALDGNGNVFVAGQTISTDFPATPGAFQTSGAANRKADAFVAKLSGDGSSILYATYLGGSRDETPYAFALDASGAAIVGGSTISTDFPTTTGALQPQYGGPPGVDCCAFSYSNFYGDGFLAKLSPDGSQLMFGTYLGGSSGDAILATGLDSTGNIWVTGTTGSRDFPTTKDSYSTYADGAFLASLSTDGSKILSSSILAPVFGYGTGTALAIGPADHVYAAGVGQVVPTPGSYQTPVVNSYVIQQAPGGDTASLTVSDSFLSFGTITQTVGTTSTPQTFTLANGGTAAARIDVSVAPPFALTDDCGDSLTAGASCTVTVVFAPVAAGGYTSGVTILSNAPKSPLIVGALGDADLPPNPVALPPSLDFGGQAVGVASQSLQTRLGGSGNTTFTVQAVTVTGPNASDFTVTPDCIGQSVLGCVLVVTFKPSGVGPRSATIAVNDNAIGSPHMVPLTGIGSNGPAISIQSNQQILNFSTQAVGSTSNQRTLNMLNSGASALHVSGISASDDFQAKAESLLPCNNVAPNASCFIDVTFAPMSAGLHSGVLTITSDATNSPFTVNLTGVATDGNTAVVAIDPPLVTDFGAVAAGSTSTPMFAGAINLGPTPLQVVISTTGDLKESDSCGGTILAGAECTVTLTLAPQNLGPSGGSLVVSAAGVSTPAKLAFTGTGVNAPAVLQLSAGALLFGDQALGAAGVPYPLTLANPGTGSIGIAHIDISQGFAQTSDCGDTLAGGSTCTMNVVFTPGAPGRATGLLAVTDSSGAQHVVGLSGRAVMGAALSVRAPASSLTFAAQGATETLAIVASGDGPVSLAISANGPYTQTNNCSASLDAGASCTVTVTATAAPGFSNSGSLVVRDNAQGSPHVVGLSGPKQ